jgi:hypothetical protein
MNQQHDINYPPPPSHLPIKLSDLLSESATASPSTPEGERRSFDSLALNSMADPLPTPLEDPVPGQIPSTPSPLGASHTVPGPQTLSVEENEQLAQCEQIINRGKQTFVEVGLALAQIRDGKLYRAEHGSFKAYCHTKWGFSKSYVYRLIEAAEIKRSPMGDQIQNERQARELASIPAADRPAVLARASIEGPPTAANIREAARTFCKDGFHSVPGISSSSLPSEAQGPSLQPSRPLKSKPSKPLRYLLLWWTKTSRADREWFCRITGLNNSPPA